MVPSRAIRSYKNQKKSKTQAKEKDEPTKKTRSKKDNETALKVEVIAEVQERKNTLKEQAQLIQATAPVAPKKGYKLVKGDFSPQNTQREDLIREYAPLIKYIAQKIAARLPANIELDDLISSGVIGLMDAIDKYDHTRDNKFKTYAEFRIRGAILDELRSQDWVPRSVREKAKMLERANAKIEHTTGRQAKDEEICSELNISKEEYFELLNEVKSVSLLSFDDVSNFSKADKKAFHGLDNRSGRSSNPFAEVNVTNLKKMVAEAIDELPEKQRLVLSLYYYEDLNLKEIGRVLDVTESRVSQLHTQAVLRLRGKLKGYSSELVSLLMS